MVQEALSNVYKHANASFLSVELTLEPDQVQIYVVDNGIGFDVPQTEQRIAKGNNFGLLGMRERVELLEGTMDLDSEIRFRYKNYDANPYRRRWREQGGKS